MESAVKAQFNNRISLKTSDATNSRIILGTTIAEGNASMLSGKGHMLCKMDSYGGVPQMAQGGFLDNSSLSELIQAINEDYQNARS